MRFLSPHPGFSIQIVPPKEVREADPITGQSYTRVDRQPFIANFECGHGLFPHEVELALEKFPDVWRGLPENTNPVTKIAVWDSEAYATFLGWDADTHAEIVKRMVNMAVERPSRMVAVADNWRPAPWPAYDGHESEEILAYVQVLGIDPENVRLYEGENKQRTELMEALRALSEGREFEPLSDESEVVATVNA